jgi:hypothetical protein
MVKFDYRGVLRLWRHPHADVAMGQLQGLVHKITKERWDDRVPGWDLRVPRIGTRVCTYAYPDVRGETTPDVVRQVHGTTVARLGAVQTVHPTGRDRVLLPYPCFETDLDLRGGMSGGPVFNSEGKLCGVNSTGYDFGSGEPPLSFISMLQPILEMRLPGDRPEGFTVSELIELRQLDAVTSLG